MAGLKALLCADVVVTDRLVPHELLAGLAPDVELIDVAKFPRSRFTAQEDINAVLLDRAQGGKNVVRLKGGDSSVFGRGFEEVLHLQHARVPVRVIPASPRPSPYQRWRASPSRTEGSSTTSPSSQVTYRPATPTASSPGTPCRIEGTIVLMMSVQDAGVIAQVLIDGGRDAGQPAAIVVDGSLASERVIRTTLGPLGKVIETEEVQPPAIIVVGDVAGL